MTAQSPQPLKTTTSLKTGALVEVRYYSTDDDAHTQEPVLVCRGPLIYLDTSDNIAPIEFALGDGKTPHGTHRALIDELGADADVFLIRKPPNKWEAARNGEQAEALKGRRVVKVAGSWLDIETGEQVPLK